VFQVALPGWDPVVAQAPPDAFEKLRSIQRGLAVIVTRLVIVLGSDSLKVSGEALVSPRTDKEQSEIVDRALEHLVGTIHKLQEIFPLADIVYLGAGQVNPVPGKIAGRMQNVDTLRKVNNASHRLTGRLQEYFQTVLLHRDWWYDRRWERDVRVVIFDVFAAFDDPEFFQGPYGRLSEEGNKFLGRVVRMAMIEERRNRCRLLPVSWEDERKFFHWFDSVFSREDWGPGGRKRRPKPRIGWWFGEPFRESLRGEEDSEGATDPLAEMFEASAGSLVGALMASATEHQDGAGGTDCASQE